MAYYNGKNIKTKVLYYTPDPELTDKVESIQFVGHGSKTEPWELPQMSLMIKFTDGSDKWFPAIHNQDGTFPKTVFEDLLKQADDYLGKMVAGADGKI